MTVTRSYSPNGIIRPNPDYDLCCGLYHTTSAAKFFAILFFVACLLLSATNFMLFGADKGWVSLFCLFFTIYCVVLLYGVFLEKPLCLAPFLVVHGIVTIGVFIGVVCLSLYGALTDGVREHHTTNQPLRDLYRMHNLNPDDEKTLTVVSSVTLFLLIALFFVYAYSWYAIYRALKCYKENDRTYLPGYQRGIVATSNGHVDV